MGVYAWCPECGAIRELRYSCHDDGMVFAWKRWVVPGDIGKAHALMKINEKVKR
jgi:hypothetical protein